MSQQMSRCCLVATWGRENAQQLSLVNADFVILHVFFVFIVRGYFLFCNGLVKTQKHIDNVMLFWDELERDKNKPNNSKY